MRMLELDSELLILKSAGKLPSQKDLWTFVHDELGCVCPLKNLRVKIEASLY
jgi:hypothetical protein